MKRILSIIFKFIVFLAAIIGTIVSYFSAGEFMTGSQLILYFTIQSNIWIGIYLLVEAIFLLTDKKITNVMNVLRLIFTVSITLTGVVFCFVLAPTLPNAFNLPNVLTHVVSPLFAIIDFFVSTNFRYSYKSNLLTTIPPLYYLGFSAIGYVAHWNFGGGVNYPYFFLNWGSEAGAFGFSNSLPFMGVFYWIMLLLAFIIGISFIYTAIINKKKKSS